MCLCLSDSANCQTFTCCLFLCRIEISAMSRINNTQKEILVDFMSTNYVSLYGKFSKSNGKDLKEILWTRLMVRLNEAGPPQKTAELWKRVSFFYIVALNLYLTKYFFFT